MPEPQKPAKRVLLDRQVSIEPEKCLSRDGPEPSRSQPQMTLSRKFCEPTVTGTPNLFCLERSGASETYRDGISVRVSYDQQKTLIPTVTPASTSEAEDTGLHQVKQRDEGCLYHRFGEHDYAWHAVEDIYPLHAMLV